MLGAVRGRYNVKHHVGSRMLIIHSPGMKLEIPIEDAEDLSYVLGSVIDRYKKLKEKKRA